MNAATIATMQFAGADDGDNGASQLDFVPGWREDGEQCFARFAAVRCAVVVGQRGRGCGRSVGGGVDR